SRHCDGGTCAWLALLFNRQHFDLYAHSARRAPLGMSPGGVLQPSCASLNLLLQPSHTPGAKLKAHTVIHFLTLCRHSSVKVYLEWRLSWPTSLMKSCCIAAELHSSRGSCSQPRASSARRTRACLLNPIRAFNLVCHSRRQLFAKCRHRSPRASRRSRTSGSDLRAGRRLNFPYPRACLKSPFS